MLHLRLMFLKFRYRLGFESLCAEVSDSITCHGTGWDGHRSNGGVEGRLFDNWIERSGLNGMEGDLRPRGHAGLLGFWVLRVALKITMMAFQRGSSPVVSIRMVITPGVSGAGNEIRL